MSPEDRIRQFMYEDMNVDKSEQLDDDYLLIERGAIDSLGIFQTVQFLESEYEVTVEDDELLLENFATIRDIARFVKAKLDPDPVTS